MYDYISIRILHTTSRNRGNVCAHILKKAQPCHQMFSTKTGRMVMHGHKLAAVRAVSRLAIPVPKYPEVRDPCNNRSLNTMVDGDFLSSFLLLSLKGIQRRSMLMSLSLSLHTLI